MVYIYLPDKYFDYAQDACHGGLWISKVKFYLLKISKELPLWIMLIKKFLSLAFMSLGTSILNVIIQKIKLMLWKSIHDLLKKQMNLIIRLTLLQDCEKLLKYREMMEKETNVFFEVG